jgi:hypothetical protein
MEDTNNTSFNIVLDRCPENEKQIECLLRVLRQEFHFQVERKRQAEAGKSPRYQPIRSLRYRDLGQ